MTNANSLNGAISRRTFLRSAIAGAAGVGAMAIAGCGDSGTKTSSTSTVTPPPTTSAPTAAAATSRPASQWTAIPRSSAYPSARRDHSLTLDEDNGLVYMFGGRRSAASMNDLWTFDPRTSVWSEVVVAGIKPTPRFAQNASYDRAKKRLIVAMGQGDGSLFFNDVWAFDIATSSWSEIGASESERPEIRYGAGGTRDVSSNRILISHGFTDNGRYDDTWSFDLAVNAWTKIATSGDVPIKRCLTRALWLPSAQMLLFGGQTDGTPYLGDFWSLDLANGMWTEKKPSVLPGPRNLYGASYDEITRRWYIAGGNTADGPTAETWMYDVQPDLWSRIETPTGSPPARYSTDAALAGGRLYIFGGHDGTTEIDDMWALDVSA